MAQGINRRFVVTNIKDAPRAIYHGFYVQRGDVPERPIGELKNGLAIDRLSSHRFLANAFTLQCHLLAYALVVLFREALQAVTEVSHVEIATLRHWIFKVGAVVQTSVRRIPLQFDLAAARVVLTHLPSARRLCGPATPVPNHGQPP